MPPPSSGGVIVEILNILAGDDLAALGRTSPAYLHLLAEAMSHGFADRARWYGDPEFRPVPIDRLTSPAYGSMLRQRIVPDVTLPQDRYGTAPDAGTTHLSVIDGQGWPSRAPRPSTPRSAPCWSPVRPASSSTTRWTTSPPRPECRTASA